MTNQTLRREDAANRATSLAWLAQGDVRRARGYARLLIDHEQRWGLMSELGGLVGAPEQGAIAEEIAEDKKYVAENARRAQWKDKGR